MINYKIIGIVCYLIVIAFCGIRLYLLFIKASNKHIEQLKLNNKYIKLLGDAKGTLEHIYHLKETSRDTKKDIDSFLQNIRDNLGYYIK